MNIESETFNARDANPGATLQLFQKYIERIKLLFSLVFRKHDGTPYEPSDTEKKAMLLYRGGDDMRELFEHVGKVLDSDSFDAAVEKITKGLSGKTNKAV